MTAFSLGAQEMGHVIPSDFAEYISIVSGRSIMTAADWGDRVEFGLSGDGMIRIFWTPEGLELNYLSTTNANEIPPLMIQISDGGKRLPARTLELRLRALRTLYALVHLSQTQRFGKVQELLQKQPDADLEDLLEPDEQLYIECLAPGSWYVTVWSTLKSSYKSILQTMALVYAKGRDTFLRKLEAEARLKELEVEKKGFELFTSKLDYGLDLMDRMNTDPAKKALRHRVETEVSRLLVQDRNSQDVKDASRKLLGGEQ